VSDKKNVVTLRTVADRVGLAPCSVSAVLNGTPASFAIPQPTKDRVFRAAAELNYQPNFSARSLRTKRTHIVAIVSNDFGRGAVGQVVAAMERALRRRGYLLTLGAIDRPSEWASLSAQLHQRGIEGVVSVGASLPRELELPSVSVHFGDLNLEEPMTLGAATGLSELGKSAAETILSKIETVTITNNTAKATPRRTRLFPQLNFSSATSAAEEPMASRQTA
jgi:transcriptional regulator with XRE-family HTH domain